MISLKKVPARYRTDQLNGEHQTTTDVRSVSALIGVEQPLIDQYFFEFDAALRVACNDPEFEKSDLCTFQDIDADGIADNLDTDSDGDGIPNSVERRSGVDTDDDGPRTI